MMRRFAITLGVPAVALLTALAVTAPAAAVTGGCAGPSCSTGLSKFITLSGNGVGQGTGYTPMPVEPPPCLWNPIGDATTGSSYIISFFNGQDPGPGGPYQTGAAFKQAKQLLASPQPGEWYVLPINPAASPAGQAECLKLPLFAWVPPGSAPPMPPVPGMTLAEYAFNHLRVTAPRLTVNPAGKGYVNLATFVWNRRPTRTLIVRATLNGTNEWAQVTATPGKMTISATGPGTPYSNCGPRGSKYPVGTVPAAASGPGTPPDCGVLWTGPASGAVVTGTTVWNITFTSYDGTAPAPTTIPMSASLAPMQVNEIQSINGG